MKAEIIFKYFCFTCNHRIMRRAGC